MAINEACQLWLDQRIEEELKSGADNMAAIGREIAAEVEKIFEAKINPETLRKRASRMSRTNVRDGGKPRQSTVSVGTVGTTDPVKEVDTLVAKGTSIRAAVEEVGAKHGVNPETLRKQRQRRLEEEEPDRYGARAYAEQAINILKNISPHDADRDEAFARVIQWVEKQRGKK